MVKCASSNSTLQKILLEPTDFYLLHCYTADRKPEGSDVVQKREEEKFSSDRISIFYDTIAGPTFTQAAQKTMKAVSVIPNLNVFVRLNIKCFTNCKQIPENNVRRSEKLSECQMSIQLQYSLLTFLFCV